MRNESVMQGRTACFVVGFLALQGEGCKVVLEFTEWPLIFLPFEQRQVGEEQPSEKTQSRNQVGWSVPCLSSPGRSVVRPRSTATVPMSTDQTRLLRIVDEEGDRRQDRPAQAQTTLLFRARRGRAQDDSDRHALRGSPEYIQREGSRNAAAGDQRHAEKRFTVILRGDPRAAERRLFLKPIHPAALPQKSVKQEGGRTICFGRVPLFTR